MGGRGEWRMVLNRWKRRRSQSSCDARIERLDVSDQETEIGTMSNGLLHFPILELPMHIIYDILSRLPLKSILTCRLVCKLFLKILKDPYFAEVHLGKAHITVNLALDKCTRHHFCMSLFMLDCDQVLKVVSSSSSIDGHHGSGSRRHHLGNGAVRNNPPHPNTLVKQNVEICFVRDSRPTIVDECRGLLCTLYLFSEELPVYCIRNPIIGDDDYVAFRYLSPSTPAYFYLDLSGFGYCPKTKVYKVIRFTAMPSHDDPMASFARGKAVVEMHTVGSDSWRRIYGAPFPKLQGAFDPYLNGFFHWLTISSKPSQLICSLDLEKECFRFIPPPEHFSIDYTKKISWINVGTSRGCLCLCYVVDHAYFEVWVMKEYGVEESWRKEFSIDINLYTGLKEEDLQRPLKFLDNGDLWLHCSTHYLVSYSPRNCSFRIFETLGQLRTHVTVHFPSFASPKVALGGKCSKLCTNLLST